MAECHEGAVLARVRYHARREPSTHWGPRVSGPWDRPSSPDDGDWPSEDIEPRSSADRPVEPWSADDPWQERRDATAGGDEWPSPAPETDDYATEVPEPPSSDPWAESWTDDES